MDNYPYYAHLSPSRNRIILSSINAIRTPIMEYRKRNINDIIPYGKNAILIFKNNTKKNIHFWLFLSKKDRELFIDLYYKGKKYYHKTSYIQNKLILIEKIVNTSKQFCNFITILLNKKLKKQNFYYNKDIMLYNIINSINSNKINLLQHDFIISHISLLLKILNRIEFRISCHVDIDAKSKKKIMKHFKNINTNSIISSSRNDNTIKNFDFFFVRKEARKRMKSSIYDNNYSFEISLNTFFCSKKITVLQYLDGGMFILLSEPVIMPKDPNIRNPILSTSLPLPLTSKRPKEFDLSEKIATFKIKQIQKIECFEYDSVKTNITLMEQEVKTHSINFAEVYDKFIFKTLIYNHFLTQIRNKNPQRTFPLIISAITWNLSNIELPSVLGCFNKSELEKVDIITMGVQECAITKKGDWLKHLKNILNYYDFIDVGAIEMWQMFLVVFIRKDLANFVDNVSCQHKAMGFGGIIGNKGGMIISFKLMNYQFVFVNCHLAPKPYKVLERNKMVKECTKVFTLPNLPFIEFDVGADYIFWLGDMNYRIDFTFSETLEKLSSMETSKAIKYLLLKDQLIKERKKNSVFHNFIEPEIKFIPTYRRKKKKDKIYKKEDFMNNQKGSMKESRVPFKTDLKEVYANVRNTTFLIQPEYPEMLREDNKNILEKKKSFISKNKLKFGSAKKVKSKGISPTPINKLILNDNIIDLNEANGNEDENENENENDNQRLTLSLFSLEKQTDEVLIEKYEKVQEEIKEYSNKQEQSPSWCDRILVKTNRKVEFLFYNSIKNMRYSDHLPVQAKYRIELLSPLLPGINLMKQRANKSIGYFHYNYFILEYDFETLFLEELEAVIIYPIRIEISCFFELKRKKISTMSNELSNNDVIKKKPIKFKGIKLPFSPGLLFEFPQGKSLNIFFVISIETKNKKGFDIGYAKYSLELLENNHLNIMNHNFKVDVIYHTRKLGEITFKSDYTI